MRKEVVLAILVGSAVGIAVAFGAWRANKAFSPQVRGEQIVNPADKQNGIGGMGGSQNGTGGSSEQGELAITSPESGIVVSTPKVIVSGSSTPYATIVIVANSGEVIIQAKANGTFSQEIALVSGANEIKVATYDKDGDKQEKTIIVVYSTEFPEGE